MTRPGLLGLMAVVTAGASLLMGSPATPARGDCGAARATAADGRAESGGARSNGTSAGPHAYFNRLIERQDCMAAYSLRDRQQLEDVKHARKREQAVTYDFANDPDPRKQDAAKIVVPADRVSLPNQVRIPIGTKDGTTTLVTWDAWFGSEFRFARAGIGTYKNFQFASPATKLWMEVRTRFITGPNRRARRARRAGQPDAAASEARGHGGEQIGSVDVRVYRRPGESLGSAVTRPAPLSPQVGTFTIRPETWTRYWVTIEQKADDFDPVSLWVADEQHDAVQIIDHLPLSVRGSVEQFWLEYNTSTNGIPENRGPLVAYARNIVVLRDPADVTGLLQRPVR